MISRFLAIRGFPIGGRCELDTLKRATHVNQSSFKEFSSMPQGTIKKKTDKGFGFITTEEGTDLFFHSSNVDGSYESLREGQKVTFSEGRGPKGPRAENVRAI